MATLTRFFSTGDVPPAINQAQMDPRAASAGAASAGAIGQAIAQGLGALGEGIGRMQANQQKQSAEEANAYASMAKLDLQLNAAQVFDEAKSKAEYGTNVGEMASQMFQKNAATYLEKAPNDLARQKLIQGMAQLQMGLVRKGSAYQTNFDTNYELENMNKATKELSNVVGQDFASIDVVKGQLTQLATSLKEKGRDAAKVDKALSTNLDFLESSAANQMANKNPIQAMELLNSGRWDGLGAEHKMRIQKVAEGSIKAAQAIVKKDFDQMKGALVEGLVLPEKTNDIVAAAKSLGMGNEVGEFESLRGIFDRIKLLPIQQQAAAKAELQRRASVPDQNLPGYGTKDFVPTPDFARTPEFLKKAEAMIDNNIKLAKEDGLTYAARVGLQVMPGSIPFGRVTEADLPALRDREAAAQRMRMMGVDDAVGLMKPELEEHKNTFAKLSPEEKLQQLKYYGQAFSPTTMYAIANKLSEKNGAMSVGALFANEQPDLARDIFKGDQLRATKQAKSLNIDAKVEAIGRVFGNLFAGSPDVRDKLADAAEALSMTKNPTDPGNVFEASLRTVSGVISVNKFMGMGGYETIAPKRDMKYSTFMTLLDTVTSKENLIKFGNDVPMFADGTEFDPKKHSTSNLKFVPVSPVSGIYKVMYRDQELRVPGQKSFLINLREAANNLLPGK